LSRLADCLTACRLTTVVMASTGVSGLPLWQRREARGCEVAWVNARHAQHGPGRPTTARFAGRWRPKRQRYGVLAPSFRPPHPWSAPESSAPARPSAPDAGQASAAQAKGPGAAASAPPARAERSPGVTGRRMLHALVAGERAPPPCAPERASRINARPETMAKAREGADRSAHLCTLTQALALEDLPPRHIADGAQDSARVLSTLEPCVAPAPHPLPPPTTTHRQPHRHAPAFGLRPPLYRLTGVDLTPGPG
jgi:transposase